MPPVSSGSHIAFESKELREVNAVVVFPGALDLGNMRGSGHFEAIIFTWGIRHPAELPYHDYFLHHLEDRLLEGDVGMRQTPATETTERVKCYGKFQYQFTRGLHFVLLVIKICNKYVNALGAYLGVVQLGRFFKEREKQGSDTPISEPASKEKAPILTEVVENIYKHREKETVDEKIFIYNNSLVHSPTIMTLPQCGHHQISHSFYETSPMIQLVCVDTTNYRKEITMLGSIFLVFPLSLLLVSYECISHSVLRMKILGEVTEDLWNLWLSSHSGLSHLHVYDPKPKLSQNVIKIGALAYNLIPP
ncbi:hypothetical protein HPG69_018470 [Diceros bicornis minor]|uniref:Uncharacterized protein n=1 Tax=Diceros bicornis minor TaxID=77932 RepID=A0A7J7EQT1_DICBM|nr:hypothetical protein HPG69_018470 [Diceros bicornis minor]